MEIIVRIRLLIIISFLSSTLFGQIDTEFWFAAPDISSEYGQAPKNGAPISLHFTALYATTVTVTRPADPTFAPIVLTLQDLEHKSVELNSIIPINQIETYPRDLTDLTAIQDKGFKITAYPGEISCYYELDNKQNKDIFPLKGTNGLGKEFFVSTQNAFVNGDYKGTAWSGFAIVATEDNTTVNVELNDDLLYFAPHPAIVSIKLNSGQTYAFRSISALADRHINGVRVTATSNIAITVYDDALQKERDVGGTSWDLFGDQIVPLSIVGNEYIIMKGFMVDAPEDGGERIFVTATVDNTRIFIDNNPLPVATINKGEVYSYAIVNQTTLVTTSAPVYINHITGFEADLGGAIIPPIGNCSGSFDVAFNRSPDPSESFYLNIMVKNVTAPGDPMRNQAARNFSITSNGVVTPIPESYFTYILDSSYAVLKRDPAVVAFIASCIEPGWAAMVRNPLTRFHLGTINGHINTGCKYGYFSDYKVINTSAGIGGALSNTREVYCDLDPIRLVARGGTRYKWTCTSDPSVTSLISNTAISDPYFLPVTSGNYMFNVQITQDCGPEVNLPLQVIIMYRPVADFDINVQEACSPFTATITPKVDMSRVGRMEWYFDYPNMTPSARQDTLTIPFQFKFPDNNTDTIIPFKIRLYTWAPFNACPDHLEKTVLIKPAVKANFTVSDSSGCHPLPVTFNNQSTGNLTSSSYYWDFGDNLQSYDSLPRHNYVNFSSSTIVFKAKLNVISPFNCRDSISRPIEVYPFIRGSLLVDSAVRCSPVLSRLSPFNSTGADTFFYTIQSPEFNQTLKKLNREDIFISYSDTTYLNGPDTIRTVLIVQNKMGCSDTVSAKDIIVYPEIRAKFDISPPAICDASYTQIINQSFGKDLTFIWDFGDGSSALDTILKTFRHVYYNLGEIEKSFDITLEGINKYQCHDSFDTTVTVYPRVNAFFTIENTNNCSPLDLKINNYSHHVAFFNWNYGDGSSPDNSSEPVIFHHYTNPLPDRDTSYILYLRAISQEGCLDSMKRTINLLPHVIADFTMSDSSGCSPADIYFQNNSTGNNMVFNWQFGDLVKTNNIRTFSETFNNYEANDSTFRIILTASNPQGCESSLTRNFALYPFVKAAFGVDYLAGCSPMHVITSNYSTSGSKFYTWNYGDGSSSYAFDGSHTYVNNTSLLEKDTLKLIVKNDHACYDTAVNIISVYPKMHADFQISDLSGCQPLEVTFNNVSNILANTSFLWDFDDGRYSNLTTPPAHTYKNLNIQSAYHNVQLKATSQYGCVDDTAVSVEVYPYIVANFTADRPEICSDEVFTLDRNTSAGAINHYYWDYENDGNIDEDKADPVFNFTYSNTGSQDLNRKIKLTVTNEKGCDTSWIENMTVHPQVRASFTADASQVCYPAATSFTNFSAPDIPLTYYWNFGDGSGSLNKDPDHSFRNFSRTDDMSFTVSLTATSSSGCDSTISHTITVHPKPLADFSFPQAIECPPFAVLFTNNSQGTDMSYFWDFDNGTASNLINPEQMFNNTGSQVERKDISLIVNTAFACSDTAVKSVSIYPGVQVDFNASSWSGCNPLEVAFDGTAFNENEYYWFVDGEAISNYEDPFYRFVNEETSDKTFNIQFKATSLNGCSDDTTKQITIHPRPIAEFLPDPQVQDFSTVTDMARVTMKNVTNTQPVWRYSWNFGDGSTSNSSAASFIKDYTIWGEKSNGNRIAVSLIAENSSNPECSDTTIHFVIINPPLPFVELGENISGCMPLTVEFPSSSKYNYPSAFQWDFGYDNMTSSAMDPAPIVYDSAGVYIVRLTVQGDGGFNWDYKTITVFPKPRVNFSFTPDYAWLRSQTEEGTPIKFFNTTQLGQSYLWNFDDGETSTEFQPMHEYMELGTYYISLISESAEGCLDTLTRENPVIIDGRGRIKYPNAITIFPGEAAEEYYNPGEPDPSIFRPVAEGIQDYRLEIYNRWGELIFVSEDVNRGWNGYIKGSPAKQDVYVWRVTATFSNGRPYVDAGDVTLLVRKNPL